MQPNNLGEVQVKASHDGNTSNMLLLNAGTWSLQKLKCKMCQEKSSQFFAMEYSKKLPQKFLSNQENFRKKNVKEISSKNFSQTKKIFAKNNCKEISQNVLHKKSVVTRKNQSSVFLIHLSQ